MDKSHSSLVLSACPGREEQHAAIHVSWILEGCHGQRREKPAMCPTLSRLPAFSVRVGEISR